MSLTSNHDPSYMRLARQITLGLVGTCLVLGGAACMATSVSHNATIHEVQIGEEVTPRLLEVQRGDEVKWKNQLGNPVQVGILNTKWQDEVVCQNGFRRFLQIEDLVTIPPHGSVSLCFSKPGTIHYNVWLDPKNLTGSMSPTSTIRIE